MTRISDLVAQASDIDAEAVDIPKWGVTVEMRGMNGATRAKYIQGLLAAQEADDTEAMAELDAHLVVACCFDPETGDPAFVESDIPMLMSKAGDIIAALSTKAQRLSGLDGKAEERLGKSSSTSESLASPEQGSSPSDASSSVSPES